MARQTVVAYLRSVIQLQQRMDTHELNVSVVCMLFNREQVFICTVHFNTSWLCTSHGLNEFDKG
jgi:hypothetical protein